MILQTTANLDQAMERVIVAQAQSERLRREALNTNNEPEGLLALTIALSRQAGTDGTSVAHEIGTRLNWPVYDHELLELIAGKTGLRTRLLESVDERRKNWLIECVEGFASSPGMSEFGYLRLLVETVLSLGTMGHCVIMGRGAAQILPSQSTLRVRLVGSLSDRVHNISKACGLSHAEAECYVKHKDRESVDFVKSHFFKDPADATQCDLLINRSRWSVPECADLVIQALHVAEHRPMEA